MKFRSLITIFLSSLILSGCTVLNKKEQAGLQIITGDQTASVFINGQYLEKSPLIEKNLKPGEYLIKIEPDDEQLASYETPVTLRAGLLTVLTWKPGQTAETSGGVLYELEKLKQKNKTEVSFVTIPDGVIITLDGGEKKIAPLSYTDIEAGQHVFEATLPSFETQKHTINVVAGHRMVVTVKLAKNDILPSPTPKPTAQATPSPTPDPNHPISSDSATINISPTNFFHDGKQVLRVREEPNISSAELGFAIVGKKYVFLGEKKNGWLKIDFAGKEGWVSGEYASVEE